MLLSRKFVSDYIDLDAKFSINEIADSMTAVGNEYDYAGPLVNATNLVTGEVLECESIPETHLHKCLVDVGNEVLNIVCGAPNVRVGLKVIVALNGAKLPGGEIKKGVIRGYESNGMLCSLAELGLDNKFLESRDKEGIHEFPVNTKVGVDAIKELGLDDWVIDFELTSNRGDLLSILGMAYELGAIYKKKVKEIDLSFKENKENIKDSFKVEVKTDKCSLFLAKKVKNVKIGESPEFIKNRLIASGIRPINNVVDISNYVMLETGQPLHFYDADSLGDTLVVRQGENGEKLKTLDGEIRTLNEEDIVIANKTNAIGLAGVMGGLSTEVEDNTKNIIIEAAIFDAVSIRKTSKKILRSEASNRFEKGLDPKRTYMAIKRSCHLLEKYANGDVTSGIIEYNENKLTDKKIILHYEKIKKVLGIDIDNLEVINILKSLGFEVIEKESMLEVIVPTRRLDILIEEDLIEEVGRIYGMDKIVGKLPKLDVVVGKYDKTKRSIKHKLCDLGLNETLSYTLISKDEVFKYTNDNFTPIMLNDPMSEDRNTLRYSILPSLVDIYKYNKAHGNTNINIFEMGACFYKDTDYKEELKLGILLSGDYYLDIPNKKVDFYILKGIVSELLDYLGYVNRYSFIVEDIPSEFHPYQSANIVLQGKNIGIIGKIHPSVMKDDLYLCEINLNKLLMNKGSRMIYKDIPKFPSIKKDVSFIVNKDISSDSIISIIKKSGGKLLTNINIFDIYVGDKINNDEKAIAFNLEFIDPTKTLTDTEVMEVFNKIINDVTTKLNCKLRSN